MATTPEWNAPGLGNEAPWDTLVLNNIWFPGRCRITGAVGIRVDIQQGKGKKGPRSKHNGVDAGTLQIELRCLELWEVHLIEDQLESIHPRKATKKSEPMPIIHPSPNFVGVEMCEVTKVHFPQIQNDEWVWRIEALEYFPETKDQKARVSQEVRAINDATDRLLDGIANAARGWY